MLSGNISRAQRPGGRVGLVLSRRGDVLVSQAQRSRMLSAAVAVVHERGYGEMSVARIAGAAGVSRRTFYDLFEDREDCFFAAFDEVVARARGLMLAAAGERRGWRQQTRGALLALLELLDREPGARSLLVTEALKAGPRVQERRAQVLGEISALLQHAGSGGELPALTGEGVTGAVLGVIHTRLLSPGPEPLVELLNPLMGMIVLPYLGRAAAGRELERPMPSIQPVQSGCAPAGTHGAGGPGGIQMRMTYRTLVVLGVIAEHPGASNRRVGDLAGVSDPGQISKLLARLQTLDLVENTSQGQPAGEPNRWQLTAGGQQIHAASRAQAHATSEALR
jgi:AcrR family transcriptional regulator